MGKLRIKLKNTTMIQVLKEFNDLLNRKPGTRVGVIESKDERSIDSGVSGKDSPEELKSAIEEAIKESLDYEDVSIVSVQSSDYGYKLEIVGSYIQDGKESMETYYITHIVVY